MPGFLPQDDDILSRFGFVSTEAWAKLLVFFAKMSKELMEECSRCREKWFQMKIRDGICMRCRGKDKNLKDGAPFFFSAANKMDPADNVEKGSGLPIPVHGPLLYVHAKQCAVYRHSSHSP